MSYKNTQVVQAWIEGNARKSSNGNLSTDGYLLWSYSMVIGRTLPNGTKQVLNARSPYRVSSTTSQHVSRAMWNRETRGLDKLGRKVTYIDPEIGDSWYSSYSRYRFPCSELTRNAQHFSDDTLARTWSE